MQGRRSERVKGAQRIRPASSSRRQCCSPSGRLSPASAPGNHDQLQPPPASGGPPACYGVCCILAQCFSGGTGWPATHAQLWAAALGGGVSSDWPAGPGPAAPQPVCCNIVERRAMEGCMQQLTQAARRASAGTLRQAHAQGAGAGGQLPGPAGHLSSCWQQFGSSAFEFRF